MIDELEARGRETAALLRDPSRAAFTWTLLPEALSLAEAKDGIAALEAEGMRAARRHIKRFDVSGVWSRYEEGGPPADLNYHVLNRDLAGALCRRTGEAAICKASDSFSRELERRCPKATTPQERSAPPSPPASRTW